MKIQEFSRIMPMPSVCLVVTHKKRILLSQRRFNHYYRPGFWQTPGGMIEHGEKLWQAAVREFKEEVGDIDYCFPDNKNHWDVNPDRADIVHVDDSVMDGHHWICVFLHLELANDNLPINPEPKKHSEWWWFTRKEVFEGPEQPPGRAVLQVPLMLMPGIDRAITSLMMKGIL